MDMAGWIKLHRKILDNPIFQKPELLQLFCYCILKANHEPKKIIFDGKEEIIERGQFITGRDALGKDLSQNGRSTYDRLKILEKLKILNIKSNNKFSVVTIENYVLYQSQDEEPNSESNNQPTTSQQRANTNKNYKNYKNYKKDISIYSPAIDFLNEKAGTSFKPSTAKTKVLIDARVNDGFVLADFKKVIEIKTNEWLGTEWEKFIRPETLFGNKFESYLNQKTKKTKEDDWRLSE